MSHTTTIKEITIKDATAIRQAVQNLKAKGVNVHLREDDTPRMYYASQTEEVGKCQFVLGLPDAKYDVGLKLNPETGEYEVIYDEYANSVSNQIGASCALPQTKEERAVWGVGQFAQEYATEAAKNAAIAQGYMVQDCFTDANGDVQLTLGVS